MPVAISADNALQRIERARYVLSTKSHDIQDGGAHASKLLKNEKLFSYAQKRCHMPKYCQLTTDEYMFLFYFKNYSSERLLQRTCDVNLLDISYVLSLIIPAKL